MASAPTATTERITIDVPTDVLRELDGVAARMGLDRGDVITGAYRRFLFSEQRWRALQASAAAAAQRAGLYTVQEMEEHLDSLDDDPA